MQGTIQYKLYTIKFSSFKLESTERWWKINKPNSGMGFFSLSKCVWTRSKTVSVISSTPFQCLGAISEIQNVLRLPTGLGSERRCLCFKTSVLLPTSSRHWQGFQDKMVTYHPEVKIYKRSGVVANDSRYTYNKGHNSWDLNRLRWLPLGMQVGGSGCGSVGRASDRNVADAGSIPRCGEGFFLPESAFSADSLTLSVCNCMH